jgi:integrase
MPREKLTARFVENVKPPTAGQVDYFDATLPAFGLRVSKDGTRSWFCFYRIDGKQVRQTIGRYVSLADGMSLADARKAAGQIFDAVDAGRDPRLEAQQERAAARRERANTVQAIATLYLANIGASAAPAEPETTPRKVRRKGTTLRSAKEIKRTLEKYILPEIGDRPIADIRRGELIDLFDAIADNHGGVQANRALAWTRRMFGWAIARDYIGASPCVGIERPAEEIERKRDLSADELREIWAACDAVGYPAGPLIQLCFATGVRRSEAGFMGKSEVNRAAGVWVIPAARQKSGVDHAVPLSPLALRILDKLLEFTGPYVFTTTGGQKAFQAIDAAKVEIDRLILETRRKADPKAEPIAHWVLHDARRAFRSGLAAAGIDREIADFCLGHVPQKLRRTYDRHSYLPEKRHAFNVWGARLEEIINPPKGGAKVVRMRRK